MESKLRQFLSARKKQHIIDFSRVSAAVLVPIFSKDGEYHILFTKRTETVKTHKGQISFPGGVHERRDETLVKTALRECSEEIGLMPEHVDILGELDDKPSVSTNYIISPFVGIIPWPYQFKLDSVETEEILESPISALLHQNCLHEETILVDYGKTATSFYYSCNGEIIWGATARILNQFLDIYRQALDKDK